MKESKLIEMQNKVGALTRVVQQLINEINNLKDLSIGTLEVVKKMPKYKKAVDELKAEMEEANKINQTSEKKLELNVE
jgi:seryl-tRNA synthetase